MNHPYKIIRSKRRTVSIEITPAREAVVRAPILMPDIEIEASIGKHEKWIEKHLNQARPSLPTDSETVEALRDEAKKIIPPKVEKFSSLMGLTPKSVKITSAKRSFGSCSGKNSLCFSLYLLLQPEYAIDYVVVHELAHIKYKNHGKDFYLLIEKYLPDYKERISVLKGKTSPVKNQV
ncbi:MAG: M48 family metallopeptidase [Clostridia bacterium]|nr:M48 family metallopeptidase [Clostridia bacterium]